MTPVYEALLPDGQLCRVSCDHVTADAAFIVAAAMSHGAQFNPLRVEPRMVIAGPGAVVVAAWRVEETKPGRPKK